MAERERHVHYLIGAPGRDCTECVEHNDITDTLLEACERALNVLHIGHYPRVFENLEAAIAKARGETT